MYYLPRRVGLFFFFPWPIGVYFPLGARRRTTACQESHVWLGYSSGAFSQLLFGVLLSDRGTQAAQPRAQAAWKRKGRRGEGRLCAAPVAGSLARLATQLPGGFPKPAHRGSRWRLGKLRVPWGLQHCGHERERGLLKKQLVHL